MSILLTVLMMSMFPTGEIVEQVTCAENGTQSYALYLPSNYSPKKPWPIMLSLDPGARGSLPVERFKSAAEEYGYVLVGSNNSRNGPIDVSFNAMTAMWEDAHQRFSVDMERVYLAGFSGGARNAGNFARLSKVVKAVIGCGAGFDWENEPTRISFSFVGVSGNRDMNYIWLKTLNAELLNNDVRTRLIVFDGDHHWPPAEVCREAVQWVEIDSYKRGWRPIDTALVEELYQNEMSRADKLEQSRKLFDAYLIYLDLRSDLQEFRDLEEVEQKIASLSGTKRLQSSWKLAQKLEKEESGYLKGILAEFLDTDRRRTAKWWQKKVRTIKDLEKRKPDRDHQLMVQRLLDSTWRNGYERAWLAATEKNYELAAYFSQISAIVMPDSPEILYNLARMYALNDQRSETLESLQKAVDAGFQDRKRIEEDSAFASLMGEGDIQEIFDSSSNGDEK